MTSKEIAEKWISAMPNIPTTEAVTADIDKAVAEALEQAAELADKHTKYEQSCNCGGLIAEAIRALIGTRKDGDV